MENVNQEKSLESYPPPIIIEETKTILRENEEMHLQNQK